MLDRMNKGVTVEQNYDAIQQAKDAGLLTRAFFVFGFPGETESTIEETKKFIEKADPDQYFVSNFIPYPCTAVWKNPEKYEIIEMDNDFNQYFCVDKTGFGGNCFSTKWLSNKDLRKLEKDFRSWIGDRKLRGDLQDYES